MRAYEAHRFWDPYRKKLDRADEIAKYVEETDELFPDVFEEKVGVVTDYDPYEGMDEV